MIIFNTLVRRKGIRDESGANTADFAGGYAGANTTSANGNSPRNFSFRNCQGEGDNIIGIVVMDNPD
jgi:hypothetical protein